MPFQPITTPDEILASLRELYHPVDRPFITSEQVADKLSISSRTARRYLNRLYAQGQVKRADAYLSSRGYGYRPLTRA